MQPMLHRCGGPRAAALPPGTRVERLPFTTIDLHCHLMTPAVDELVMHHPRQHEDMASQQAALSPESLRINREMFASLLPKLIDVDRRLADMDAMGVDIQVISPSPTQYCYWAEPDLAEEIARLQNDEIGRICDLHPRRFLGLGTVALQHPALAAAQLEELVRKRGFKGVQVSTLVDGVDLADRRFDPFWSKADELGALIFVHPWGTTVGNRLADHYLMNIIGQPFETTVCLSKLIFGGTLDRHPTVKILAAHGGGYLPLYAGRSDHARAVRPEAGGCACCPSDYLKRIWYDTIVYGPADLARLAEVVGTERIVVGTDYPFDMGHYHPSDLVKDFDERVQQQILGGNAATLLGLTSSAADQLC